MEDPQEISEILSDCLYLSGIQALQDVDTLKHLGITLLFNLSTINHHDPPLPHNIQYYKFDILDSVDQNITVIMKQICGFFETQCLSTRMNDHITLPGKPKGKALIYCQQGILRSSTVAIYCVMKSSLFSYFQSQGTLSSVSTYEQHPAAFIDTGSVSDSHLLSTSSTSSIGKTTLTCFNSAIVNANPNIELMSSSSSPPSPKQQLQLPMSSKASFQLVKSKRRVILPNTGFMRQLLTAERELLLLFMLLLLKSTDINKDDDYNVKLEINEEEDDDISGMNNRCSGFTYDRSAWSIVLEIRMLM